MNRNWYYLKKWLTVCPWSILFQRRFQFKCQSKSRHQRNSFPSATALTQSGSTSRRLRMTWQSSSLEQQNIFTHFPSSQSLSNLSVTQSQTHSTFLTLTQRRSKKLCLWSLLSALFFKSQKKKLIFLKKFIWGKQIKHRKSLKFANWTTENWILWCGQNI